MVTNSPIRLTEDERLHQYVMHNIVKQIQSTSYILKGGTALILTRACHGILLILILIPNENWILNIIFEKD